MNLEKKKAPEVEMKPVEEEKTEEKKKPIVEEIDGVKKLVCPECGSKFEFAEGCFICLNCGYSGCA